MKKLLVLIGAGFVLGIMFAPQSGAEMRRRVRSLFGRKPWKRQYDWRDPDDRLAMSDVAAREKMMDKTLADSFPASDPPSSIPNPSEDSLVA